MTKSIAKAFARPALAATLAASIALTPVAAMPARADEQVGAIAAAGILALLMSGIFASGQDQGGLAISTPPRGNTGLWDRDREDGHRPRLDPRRALPEVCEFTLRHGRDRGTYYGRHCLVQNFGYWPYLPDRCEQRVSLRDRFPTAAYDAQCLARFGYREAERDRRIGY